MTLSFGVPGAFFLFTCNILLTCSSYILKSAQKTDDSKRIQ